MALPRAVRTPIRVGARLHVRMPLAAVTPALDALALVAAAALAGQANGLGIAYVVAVLLIPVGAGFRPSRISPRLSQDVGPLLARVAIPVIPLALLTPTNADAGRFLVTGVLAAALLLLARFLAYALIRAARAGGFLVERALIAGAGSTGIEIASTLKDHPEYGLEPIGFLDSFQEDGLPLPILGECRDLPDVVRTFHANRVIVAFGATREPEMVQVLRACDELPVEVHLVPRFFELGVAPGGPLTDDIWGIPLVRLRRSALRSVAWGAKRAFDIVFGGLLLVVTSPLFLACAVAVRLSGPGPILFRQERIGQRGEVFELLKFRSMLELPDSDTVWAVDEEERCTAVGRILRRSDLDELPQLINVLRGEMSLVGPRPERPFFADQFRVAVPGYGDRHRVPVGMSGWAQVHGLRGNTSIAERARFDNHYIEHWSMWKDALIVVRTVGHVIRGAVGRRA